MDSVSDEAKAHPLERFGKEALRLVGVLEGQLNTHTWVAGNTFTVADIVSVGSWMEVEQSRYHKNARCHGMDNTSQTATRRRPWHCSWRTCGRNRSLESRAQGAIPSQRVTDHQSWVVSFRMKKNPVLAARRTRPMLLDSLDHPSSCPILPFLFR